MKKLLCALFIFQVAPFQTSQASENPGKTLVDNTCQQCHDNGMYTRSNSILRSYPELQARVEFCENASKARWNETQVDLVVDYLNDTYYKFPKP